MKGFRKWADENCPEITDDQEIILATAWVDGRAPLIEAIRRAEMKLSAYVGVCKDDKELVNTVLPMLRDILASECVHLWDTSLSNRRCCQCGVFEHEG